MKILIKNGRVIDPASPCAMWWPASAQSLLM